MRVLWFPIQSIVADSDLTDILVTPIWYPCDSDNSRFGSFGTTSWCSRRLLRPYFVVCCSGSDLIRMGCSVILRFRPATFLRC